jgi:peptidoglycan hydrolase-like protein with peptidoglycan-binding domain
MNYAKRGLIVLLVLSVVLPQLSLAQSGQAQVFSATLRKGQQSESVEQLQYILKSDSSVYPEGLTTGYYGTLTERAVKRLQAKYGITETGIVDEDTQTILFPYTGAIEVKSPNGGEVWNKSNLHQIRWVTGSIGWIQPLPMMEAEDSSKMMPRPFFQRATITLIRDSNKGFQRHIGTVELTDQGYTWKIPSNIPNGNDYRIRIGVGDNIACAYKYDVTSSNDGLLPPCLSRPHNYFMSDTSDGTFSITGDNIVIKPNPDVIAKLKAQTAEIERELYRLIEEIRDLKRLIELL